MRLTIKVGSGSTLHEEVHPEMAEPADHEKFDDVRAALTATPVCHLPFR